MAYVGLIVRAPCDAQTQWVVWGCVDLVLMGLLYKAYPDFGQQVLLRLGQYPMRGHQLL